MRTGDVVTASRCTCPTRRRVTGQHNRGCPRYVAPTPWRLCRVCGGAVAVIAVEPSLGRVRVRCRRCGRDGVDDVLDPDDHDDEDDDPDPTDRRAP